MLNWYKNMRIVPKIVLFMTLLLVLSLGLLTWQIQTRSASAIESVARRELAALAGENGNRINSFLSIALGETASMGDALAHALAAGQAPPRELLVTLQQGVLAGNSDLFGVGAMWEPNGYDGKDADHQDSPGSDAKGRFLPYTATGAGLVNLGGQLNEPYYTVPKSTRKTFLSNPAPYNVNGKDIPMSTVACPVLVNQAFRGVVLVDISLERLNQLVTSIKAYQSGYAVLQNDQGLILAHHKSELLGTNIFTIRALRDETAASGAFKAGQPYFEAVDTPAGTMMRYFQPVPVRNSDQHWYLSITAPKSEVMAQAEEISRLTLTMSALILVALLAATFLLVRSSLRPVGYLAKAAEIIAGGNLRHTIEDESFGGEMKTLSTSLKAMIQSLLDNIGKAEGLARDAGEESEKARQATREAEEARTRAEGARRDGMLAATQSLESVGSALASASTELSAQIEQADHSAAQAARRLAEAATAMNEMNATVQEVARNASEASAVSAETSANAESGATVVQHSLESIAQVQTVSLELKSNMSSLNEHAQAITHIMNVISDIADQTNLLALNAAIEAARAGEAGRGFAVVADEVRKLAEKTMVSTSDVGNAIAAIQKSSSQSVGAMDKALQAIETATTYANQSGEALRQIVNNVETTADQVRAIATASEEQSAASEEINHSIVQVNDMAGQSVQAMAEAARAVADLARQAQELDRLIAELKRG